MQKKAFFPSKIRRHHELFQASSLVVKLYCVFKQVINILPYFVPLPLEQRHLNHQLWHLLQKQRHLLHPAQPERDQDGWKPGRPGAIPQQLHLPAVPAHRAVPLKTPTRSPHVLHINRGDTGPNRTTVTDICPRIVFISRVNNDKWFLMFIFSWFVIFMVS